MPRHRVLVKDPIKLFGTTSLSSTLEETMSGTTSPSMGLGEFYIRGNNVGNNQSDPSMGLGEFYIRGNNVGNNQSSMGLGEFYIRGNNVGNNQSSMGLGEFYIRGNNVGNNQSEYGPGRVLHKRKQCREQPVRVWAWASST
ncbi:hypothetical protein J6590_062457 [Homalodisca vitripennis]|nr:hypothetical protein J6590_062457 [Homalodisca vitripennis]